MCFVVGPSSQTVGGLPERSPPETFTPDRPDKQLEFGSNLAF
jgi:hypothetical protein